MHHGTLKTSNVQMSEMPFYVKMHQGMLCICLSKALTKEASLMVPCLDTRSDAISVWWYSPDNVISSVPCLDVKFEYNLYFIKFITAMYHILTSDKASNTEAASSDEKILDVSTIDSSKEF